MFSFDFWCLWQDRILQCALPPGKTPTMIWMMNAPWIRMNPWFCRSRAFAIHYTLILPDIVYNIILYISHSYCDKRHSLTATAINDLITAIPWPLPLFKIFHNWSIYFHKYYKGPEQLGFVNTSLYEDSCRDFLVGCMETELVWARRMDSAYVLGPWLATSSGNEFCRGSVWRPANLN